jgi:electron transfer flavoprotein alpha subunit
MSENVWVLAPMWRGRATAAAFELLQLGRELADQLNERLCAVCWGHELKEQLHDLKRADQVLCIDHSRLANATPEVCAGALEALARSKMPRCILIPSAHETWELLGELPERLQAPFLNFCTDVRVVDGGLEARCLLYGGKIEAVAVATATPALLGVLPGARTVHTIPAAPMPELEFIAPSLPDKARMRLCRYLDPEVSDVDIAQQKVVVSVGRGIESEANVNVAKKLARNLRGTVCGSRPVIDRGWLPTWRQIGKSGVCLRPRLYIAAGVSGAPEHVEGMRHAELVIAINKDPQAPIFNAAQYGIVADAAETLGALVETVRPG